MNKLTVTGKGAYIWRIEHIFNGDINAIRDALVDANVNHVAIKAHNGYFAYTGLLPLISLLRKANIDVGIWGYIYLDNPELEALVLSTALRIIQPKYYLLDAEGHTKNKNSRARTFAAYLKKYMRYMNIKTPIGMNSYWQPAYHRNLPWNELRSICDFDAPQVYWRGSQPIRKLSESILAYNKMPRKLPFAMPAGDMYYEHGIMPTSAQVTEFLHTCDTTPNIQSVIMWSMDQNETTPSLWKAFAQYNWGEDNSENEEIPDEESLSLYPAVVTAWALNVSKGDRIDIYKIVHRTSYKWGAINKDESKWVALDYTRKI